ncbi:hypothetical protein J6590_011227 [Homalodisca vitripennis]|nr:hypothetical protein J6590_011227 [Homalodisca vitripennis]
MPSVTTGHAYRHTKTPHYATGLHMKLRSLETATRRLLTSLRVATLHQATRTHTPQRPLDPVHLSELSAVVRQPATSRLLTSLRVATLHRASRTHTPQRLHDPVHLSELSAAVRQAATRRPLTSLRVATLHRATRTHTAGTTRCTPDRPLSQTKPSNALMPTYG